jgi:hypothetical protein
LVLGHAGPSRYSQYDNLVKFAILEHPFLYSIAGFEADIHQRSFDQFEGGAIGQ